uniref:Uncharacterized protein n=1 Tax=Anguilla anguilla TaxID=7936 RepID=A0A0E9PWH6_ANGAN
MLARPGFSPQHGQTEGLHFRNNIRKATNNTGPQ